MSPGALREVYITGTGAFLPGAPVPSSEMEGRLGLVGGRRSTVGRRALSWNGVETRHYAIDAQGAVTHSNAGMCALAARAALEEAGLAPEDLDFLAAATTQGDQLAPGHASAVHAALSDGPGGAGPLEIASFQSVCASALMAAKDAWLQVRAGEANAALACAGEFSSRWFQPSFYDGTELVDAKGRLALEADFLRFTLSDGAGALVMEPHPRPAGGGFRVDWIDLTSLADRFDACMWAGATAESRNDPTGGGWAHAGPLAAHAAGAVALQQDFDLLKRVIRAWVGVWLEKVESGRIDPDLVDHLLVHYSARSLRREIVSLLEQTKAMIPEEKWFSNLPTVGNVGSASIWVMLDEFARSGRARPGEKVLLVVPESGRAVIGFMMLEAL